MNQRHLLTLRREVHGWRAVAHGVHEVIAIALRRELDDGPNECVVEVACRLAVGDVISFAGEEFTVQSVRLLARSVSAWSPGYSPARVVVMAELVRRSSTRAATTNSPSG